MSSGESYEPIHVGLLIGDYLRPSETFIYDQLVMARRTRPYVCARRLLPRAEAEFPYRHVRTLGRAEELLFKVTRRAPSFSRYLRESEVELLHAHFGLNGAHALELVEGLKIPLVVSFHGHDVAGLESRNRYTKRYFQYQLLRDRLWERASLLLAASEDLGRRLVELHAAPPEKVVVHRLGVDLERFRFVERARPARVVLSVGRLVEKKGLRYGIQAFARALPRLGDARYRIVGEGPLRPELEGLARELGIEGRVDFLGALAHGAVKQEMNQADVFLCPSVTARDGDLESGVIVVKEAAATGLVVIGSRHGGIPEIVEEGRTGALVDERDVGGLAARLVELFERPGIRSQWGRAASEKMSREFDSRTQNASLEERLCELARPR